MTLNIPTAFSWLMENTDQIISAVLGIIAAASLLVKALEALTSFLVNTFPTLKTVDGELVGAAAWLDWLSKAKFFNALALSPVHGRAERDEKAEPKPAPPTPPTPPDTTPRVPPPKLPLILLALAVSFVAGAADAAESSSSVTPEQARILGEMDSNARESARTVQTPVPGAPGFDWSIGPTIPFLEFDPGNPHPVSISPGAGMQVSLTHDSLKRAMFGKSWDILAVDLMAFGSVLSGAKGQQFGALSLALAACTMSALVCVGGGKHVLTTDQSFARGGWFLALSLGINFSLGPYTPPTGIRGGAAGLVRGNTVYF